MEIKAFTKHNPLHHSYLLNWPEEDSFKFKKTKEKTIIAVADGITRDPTNLEELPEVDTLIGDIELMIDYPIPSPAREAADTFCDEFIKQATKESAKESAIKANKKIQKLNKDRKIDYLANDFAACVASAGIIKNNELEYCFITDCGVAIFDKNGKLRFKTKHEEPNPRITKEIAKQPEKYGTSWRDPRTRARVRSHYRNNPQEQLSYGALTGETTAIKFLRTGKQKIKPNEFVVFYSDGFHPIIISKKFNILKQFNNLEEYFEKNSKKIGGSEGTLVAIKT